MEWARLEPFVLSTALRTERLVVRCIEGRMVCLGGAGGSPARRRFGDTTLGAAGAAFEGRSRGDLGRVVLGAAGGAAEARRHDRSPGRAGRGIEGPLGAHRAMLTPVPERLRRGEDGAHRRSWRSRRASRRRASSGPIHPPSSAALRRRTRSSASIAPRSASLSPPRSSSSVSSPS